MRIRTDRNTGERRCDVPTCTRHQQLWPVGELALCRFHWNTTAGGFNLRRCDVDGCDSFASEYGIDHLCSYHIADRQRRVETVTPNGAHICHARGCLKKNMRSCVLTWAHEGIWCQHHLRLINDIRYMLDSEKPGRAGNRSYELYWREQELRFRKQSDPKHVWYLEKLRFELGHSTVPMPAD